jgi:DNA-binding response OmpR family regulator
MSAVNLLLGNSEDVLNGLIENAVQEACGRNISVRTASARSADDFLRQGRRRHHQLAIVIANNLLGVPGRTSHFLEKSESLRAISSLKQICPAPILVLAAFNNRELEEKLLLQAGADCVLELPFLPQNLMAAVRSLLHLDWPANAEAGHLESAFAHS